MASITAESRKGRNGQSAGCSCQRDLAWVIPIQCTGLCNVRKSVSYATWSNDIGGQKDHILSLVFHRDQKGREYYQIYHFRAVVPGTYMRK